MLVPYFWIINIVPEHLIPLPSNNYKPLSISLSLFHSTSLCPPSLILPSLSLSLAVPLSHSASLSLILPPSPSLLFSTLSFFLSPSLSSSIPEGEEGSLTQVTQADKCPDSATTRQGSLTSFTMLTFFLSLSISLSDSIHTHLEIGQATNIIKYNLKKKTVITGSQAEESLCHCVTVWLHTMPFFQLTLLCVLILLIVAHHREVLQVWFLRECLLFVNPSEQTSLDGICVCASPTGKRLTFSLYAKSPKHL